MRIYLDNCCLNRPFDDQSQARIRLETEAKLEVQQRIQDGIVELAWSYMVDFENQANPFEERREAIARWRSVAVADVDETPEVLRQAHDLQNMGLRPKDSIHIACAMAAGCAYFLTTDDLIIAKMRGFAGIHVVNPTQYIVEVG